MYNNLMTTTTSSDKILHILKTCGPQTAQTLAEQLGMTSMGARQHLLQLEQNGLVNTFDRKEKVGRPSRYWQLTSRAQDRFPDRHTDLTLNLIVNVREVFGEEGLTELIDKREKQVENQYQEELSSLPTLEAKLYRLAELRSQEGYMADVIKQDDHWLFIENHCPICAAATNCQSFCDSELKIFRSCLNVDVQRSEYILDGGRRCAYLIKDIPAQEG